jgi:hypothetical protein
MLCLVCILLITTTHLLTVESKTSTNPRVKVSVRPTESGQFDVLVDGEIWFPGSTHNVTLNNHELKKKSSTTTQVGVDKFGPHTVFTTNYDLAGDQATIMVTTARVYDMHVIFSQSFPNGATNTANGDRDSVLSIFPSFSVANSTVTGDRGYLQFAGDMVGSAFHLGQWNSETTGITSGIKGTGPLCVFQKSHHLAAVFSPYSNAMAHNQAYKNNILDYGIMGNITFIPAGYEISTIVSFAEGGVNNAMIAWGDILLQQYEKYRNAAWEKDYALQYLGYSTDNGAYYYYTTEAGKNYEETMIDVANQAKKDNIPYRYWLADSWWYYKGDKNGVKNWTAMTSIFPHGMDYIYDQTGWLVQGHNRYWSMNTDYAKQNGGNWNFILDPSSQYALPNDQEFWNYLMKSSKKWGLTTYEQDWLDDEFDNFLPLTNSATLGRDWLMQMGTAAEKNGIAIQYCMSHCRHMMASVEIPAVTQARASGDYQQSRSDQWSQLGTTSLFSFALGVAPSKDNYWSTSVQIGNKWGDNSTEKYPRLQAAVLTLTKGPVCPSDKIGDSNRELIMRSAMSDGTLLQPDRPATQLDSMFIDAVFSAPNLVKTVGSPEIWFADTTISNSKFGVMFGARLNKKYEIDVVNDLGFNAENFVAVETNTTNKLTKLQLGGRLTLSENDLYDFVLYNFAERFSNGWAFLGECKEKWVGVSKARVQSIAATDSDLSIIVKGEPMEIVTMTFVPPNSQSTVEVSCKIGQGSTVRFSIPSKECY